MKTKKLFYYLVFIFFFMNINNYRNAQAQNDSSSSQIIAMLNTFYEKYIAMIAKEPPKLYADKMDSILKKRCTKNLLRFIKYFKYDYDPIIKAQDADIECLKTLTIKKEINESNKYIVSYFDNYTKTEITINLIIVKEKESYKIDSIW